MKEYIKCEVWCGETYNSEVAATTKVEEAECGDKDHSLCCG